MNRLRSLKKHKKQARIASREKISIREKGHAFHRNMKKNKRWRIRWAEMQGIGVEMGG